MKDLFEYTLHELRAEVYKREKINRVSEKDKIKCFNCKHRACHTMAEKLHRKNLLKYKYSFSAFSPICLMRESEYLKGYHMRVSNQQKGCELFENKNNE